jgi:glycine cleavage system aminomethyltransferase T
MGWRTGKMLAVAWIDSAGVEQGDKLQVQILLSTYDAQVVADPVYDPENKKLMG